MIADPVFRTRFLSLAGVMVLAATALVNAGAAGLPLPGAGTWRHEVLRRFPAAEANQGVAADDEFLYVISNFALGKYRKDTGQRVGGWKGVKGGPIIHMNAGTVREKRLYCAHSNFPGVPMTSSVEVFDTAAMQHIGTHSFGIDSGSLTWIVWKDGHWFACFANYTPQTNASRTAKAAAVNTERDNSWTQLVKFDEQWRRVEGWVFPRELIEQFGGNSSSGGDFGPGGALFMTGHDAQELYVMDFPEAGSIMKWTATIPIAAEGQAFAWEPSKAGIFYGISRRTREVIVSRITTDR